MSEVTAFLDDAIVARGEREQVRRLLEESYASDLAAIRVFENEGGRITDLDYNPPHSSPFLPGTGRGKIGRAHV